MNENLELREWIAVNVMGLPNVVNHGEWLTYQGIDDAFTRPVPPYELTWNDAALVVEAMRAREWIFSMKSYMSNSVYPWGASFAQPFSGVVQMEPGNFAPLAICLAAKAAIEATQ